MHAGFRKSGPAVNSFGWFNVPVPPNCTASGNFPLKMKINDRRKFHGSHAIRNTSYSVTIHGKFSRHHTKATGTIRLKGTFSGGCTVDTGNLDWTAAAGG
jgi:hypothetical protein